MRRLIVAILFLSVFINACTKKEKSASTENDSVDATVSESIARGQIVYKQYCIACHMADGLGAPPMNPPLSGTSFIKGDKNLLIPVILKGMTGQSIDGQKYHNVMPPLDFLTDEQIADVLTYVRNSFGNKEDVITSEQVSVVRGK